MKEELEDYKISIAKEAWDAVNTCTPYHPESFVQGYIAGAGVKRDQIKILGDRCNQLLKDKGDLTDECKTLLKKIASRDKCIEEKEKSIAELKEINEGYCRNRDRLVSIGFPHFKDCKEYAEKLKNLEKENAELSKARKIIQRITEWADWQGPGCPTFADIKRDAEEFLKEPSHD